MPNKIPKAVRKQMSSWLLNELVYLSVSVQFSSDSLRPHGLQPPGFPIHHQIPELAQTHVHQVSNAIQPSHSLLPLLLLPSIFPGNRIFSNESVFCIRWTKYWSFSFSISPSNEYSGLIAFRMTGLINLQSKGLSRVFSNTTVQKHQFFGTQLSLWCNSHIHI